MRGEQAMHWWSFHWFLLQQAVSASGLDSQRMLHTAGCIPVLYPETIIDLVFYNPFEQQSMLLPAAKPVQHDYVRRPSARGCRQIHFLFSPVGNRR